MTPAVAFGVAAAGLAASDSGVAFDSLDPARLGAFVGSRMPSSDRQSLRAAVRLASEDGRLNLERFAVEGLPLVNPMWLLKGLANNVPYFVSLKYNIQGMNNNISMGGVGGTLAIGEALDAIRHGHVDLALAGGYDSVLDVNHIEMFGASRLVATAEAPGDASRPFDRRRNGFALGEGAGFVVLEEAESARRRGARVYGELAGYGSATVPCRSPLGPSAEGFARALGAALSDAGGEPPDAVFAHGLATPSADAEETMGIKQVLGRGASTIPVPAVKSMIGNTFAASGAVELIAAVHALRDGCVPPTINLTEADEACDLDYVAGSAARPCELQRVALSNANLTGTHAALVVCRSE